MEIEIYADVICPWCYIGKRRLDEALASYEGEVTVRYRPFQLDPSPVPQPLPLVQALAGKFGGPERARQMVDHVIQVAAADGLRLDYDRAVIANTFEAHRLVAWATEQGRAADMVEALYQAHFNHGVDVGSREALATLAGEIGLDAADARRFLDSDERVADVAADLAAARDLGITSVPTFVLAGKYAVSGAQEVQTLLAALAEVEQRESAAHSH
ncbi:MULTISPECIES: DsbA family protein [Micromonospora]|uniref:DsbA family dithiol-disulfide isomerase n=1 Tax=Micromonospora vinacea TaxID=709878 RepID=A0ABS0JYJ2_9ACTN|nr:DsbA family oxidoreductase [Micromonospora vinacea]MBG6101448.1 putative DsbA family dithiol-disulfide isomerase [Micromonospora vinacea]WSZ75710.1 DsbA family oxidoreductase [Micromonospora sp. NBC_00860]WTA67805.1 DsbA family oxidoreductase [Micromonospora sp. NBC_00855]